MSTEPTPQTVRKALVCGIGGQDGAYLQVGAILSADAAYQGLANCLGRGFCAHGVLQENEWLGSITDFLYVQLVERCAE